MPQESKLTPEFLRGMLEAGVEAGNRLESDEPLLVMPNLGKPPKPGSSGLRPPASSSTEKPVPATPDATAAPEQ